jgi:hypothetical protein
MSTQCEQLFGVPSSPETTLFDSNLSQSYCQPMHQSLQCLPPPDHFDCSTVYPAYLKGQSLDYAALEQESCFTSPYNSYPVFWEEFSVNCPTPGLEECGHIPFFSATPSLHHMYYTSAQTGVVCGSSDGSMGSSSAAWNSNSARSNSAVDKRTRRGKPLYHPAMKPVSELRFALRASASNAQSRHKREASVGRASRASNISEGT